MIVVGQADLYFVGDLVLDLSSSSFLERLGVSP
jgi:hypothetical protein